MSKVASVTLQEGQVEGLELIVEGLLPGIPGYSLPGGPRSRPNLLVPATALGPAGSEVHLCDSQSTPLASLLIRETREAGPGAVWVAGDVRKLRPAEHGPAREERFVIGDDLSRSTVAMFSEAARPADVLRSANEADGDALVLVAHGGRSRQQSAALVADLEAAARYIPGAGVRYVPAVSGFEEFCDVPRDVVVALGAERILDFRRPAQGGGPGAVLLFTGLSGSGKSTVAQALVERLARVSQRRAVLLDGDDVRRELAGELGFSAEDRTTNLLRQAWVGARVAEAGGIAVCAPIAPFESTRKLMRQRVEPQSTFVLIHVATPLAVAEARDRKGLYARARAGLIPDFTGIDSPYEIPTDADVEIDTSETSVSQCVEKILEHLIRRKVVAGPLADDGRPAG